MDLYLVRHAIAFDADTTRWPDDKDRPLTPQGEKRFRRAARGLARLVTNLDTVLSSPYTRAWQTAELLADDAKWPKPQACEALEPGRMPAATLQVLQDYPSSARLALVGHEPTLHELVSYLLTAETGHVKVEFRKGGVARLSVPGAVRPGAAVMLWLLAPKVLRELAS